MKWGVSLPLYRGYLSLRERWGRVGSIKKGGRVGTYPYRGDKERGGYPSERIPLREKREDRVGSISSNTQLAYQREGHTQLVIVQ
jgi:hypothetical protein